MSSNDCAPVGSPLLFKVLVGGRSCHGGKFRYRIGEWTPAIAEPRCCSRGYHLTSDPLRWWKPRAQVFLAAGRGARDFGGDHDDKCAFESVYLVQKVTRRWPCLPLLPRLRAFLAASARSFSARADVRWAELGRTDLSGAYLGRTDLSGAYLEEANLHDCYLGEAKLASATLTGAILASTCMACSNLSHACLLRVQADRVNLTAANLTRVVANSSVFTRAKLIRTQLSGAYLERVDLTGANCQDADFHDAVLTRAVLREADFTNADLAGANLVGADVTGANFSGARRRPDDPPIPGWTLENGRLRRA